MKFQIMLRILFRLLKNRKASARELARENSVSERSIYRYAEELIGFGRSSRYCTRQGRRNIPARYL